MKVQKRYRVIIFSENLVISKFSPPDPKTTLIKPSIFSFCHTDFKATRLNGLQVKSINHPESLNEMFTLANSWMKPEALLGGGCGSTYKTRATRSKRKKGKRKSRPSKREGETEETKKQDQKGKTEIGKK